MDCGVSEPDFWNLTLGEFDRIRDAHSRALIRGYKRDARNVWMMQALRRRSGPKQKFPTLDRFMRELFPDKRQARFDQAKAEFEDLLETPIMRVAALKRK